MKTHYYFTGYMDDADEFEDTYLEKEEVKVIDTFSGESFPFFDTKIQFENGETMLLNMSDLEIFRNGIQIN